MRRQFALIAIPALSLLAACGDTTPASEIEAEPMDESAIVDDADVIAAAEGEATPAALDGFAGSWSRESDGGIETLDFNGDGTYAYSDGDGAAKSGSFERMDDGRLMIADLDGADAYFALSGGDLYRLESAETPTSEVLPGNRFTRTPSVATPAPAETPDPAAAD